MDITEPVIKSEEILFLDDPNFADRHVCIVTGCASGIGRATAVAAAANGLCVAGLDIDEAGARKTVETAAELGGEVTFVKADLTDDDAVGNAATEAAGLGTIKYLANIAGIQHIDTVEDFPMEKYDLMHGLMLRAPLLLSKLCIPHMKASGDGTGVVGSMASIHAHICTARKSAYNITKFGLRGLTQSIAAEGEGKIRAFSVSVGFVKTPLALNQVAVQAEQRGITPEEVVQDVMMGKSRTKTMMSPIEVANLFLFGFSRFSRCLVGGDLLFDGGVVLTY
ncbi:SDR family oxidoreductase [Verrucomicrobiota bacterium]